MKLFLFLSLLSYFSLAQNLNGVWTTDCQQGNKKIQVIREPLIYTFEIFHKDSQCQERQFYFLNVGSFIRTTNTMDYQFSGIYLNVTDPNIIESFNRQSMCDLTHWTQNKDKEITGRMCLFFSSTKKAQIPRKGEFRYGIYKRIDNKIYFGKFDKNHNALTPEQRPVELDPRFYTLTHK